MALNQTNKLVWIVETIYRAHKISFEELNRRWMDNVDLSGGEEMLKRTFHKWKWNIFDTFGLSIECEKTAPYRYYIANENDMKSGSIGNWLLSTLSVSNFLLESKSIKNRIILEDVPSGREYLELIIDAMKKNRFIHITYFTFSKIKCFDSQYFKIYGTNMEDNLRLKSKSKQAKYRYLCSHYVFSITKYCFWG